MKIISNKWLIFLFLLVIIGVYTLAGYFIITPEPLIIQGEVEAAQVKVSSKIAGRVKALHTREGSSVEKGQLLISIESPEIDAKLRQAQAAEKIAAARKTKAEKGARKEEILAANNIWLKAKAAEDLAEKTHQRIKLLYEDGVLPAQKMDEAEAQYIAAQKTTQAAKANYDMAVSGARREDKLAAEAMMNQAEGVVAEVEAYLKETEISAPIKGEVTGIISEAGELVSPGFPIITLVDLDDVWVSFHLREDLLADIRMGSVITARFPAMGDRKIKLKINYITALGQYATWHATKTSGDFDLKTFEVRGTPVDHIEGLRPGMSALVTWN